MNVLLQNITGDIIELNGKVCERLICAQALSKETGCLKPLLFWLKVCEESLWHRFFIDGVQCLHWWTFNDECEIDKEDREVELQEFLEDEDITTSDVGELSNLVGSRIEKISMQALSLKAGCLTICFSNERVLIFCCDDEDSMFTVK